MGYMKGSLSKRLRALSAAPRRDLDPAALAASLSNESDRAFIIVTGSLAEDRLRDHICLHLDSIGGDFGDIDKRDGPGSYGFAQLINFARTIGLVGLDLERRLNVIRQLRNAAAHSLSPIRFDQALIREAALEIIQPATPRHAHTLRYALGARCQVVGLSDQENLLWDEFLQLLPGIDQTWDKLLIK